VSGHCRTWVTLTAAITAAAASGERPGASLVDQLRALFASEGARMKRVAHMLDCPACRTWNGRAVVAELRRVWTPPTAAGRP
jgi:hypothetical protein